LHTRAKAPFRSGEDDVDRERRVLIAARSLVDRMRVLYRQLEDVTGAPVQMHRALARIQQDPGLHASALADALGVSRPAMSQLLRGLAAREWIDRRRSKEDQRAVRLYLTPTGTRILAATSGRASGALQRALRMLTDEELAGLERGLSALLPQLPDGEASGVTASPRKGRTRTRRTAASPAGSNPGP
jgi:DNA-binding MarR family transcriptional regulator